MKNLYAVRYVPLGEGSDPAVLLVQAVSETAAVALTQHWLDRSEVEVQGKPAATDLGQVAEAHYLEPDGFGRQIFTDF